MPASYIMPVAEKQQLTRASQHKTKTISNLLQMIPTPYDAQLPDGTWQNKRKTKTTLFRVVQLWRYQQCVKSRSLQIWIWLQKKARKIDQSTFHLWSTLTYQVWPTMTNYAYLPCLPMDLSTTGPSHRNHTGFPSHKFVSPWHESKLISVITIAAINPFKLHQHIEMLLMIKISDSGNYD